MSAVKNVAGANEQQVGTRINRSLRDVHRTLSVNRRCKPRVDFAAINICISGSKHNPVWHGLFDRTAYLLGNTNVGVRTSKPDDLGSNPPAHEGFSQHPSCAEDEYSHVLNYVVLTRSMVKGSPQWRKALKSKSRPKQKGVMVQFEQLHHHRIRSRPNLTF